MPCKYIFRGCIYITHLCTGNGLSKAKEKSQVAVDLVVTLELTRSLDTLPGGRDLDQDTVLVDTLGLVERNELLGLGLGGLLVEGETGIDLGRDTAGNNLEDFLAKVDELRSVALANIVNQ
jgi:hypothetical protein